MSILISIDPGNKKCGLLLADTLSLSVIQGHVVQSSSVISLLNDWHSNNKIERIIIGNGTTSKFWELELINHNFKNLNFVDETGTTLKARKRYWELWPPRNLLRLLPRGILFTPDNLDSLAAMILLEDYLKHA